MNDQLICPHCKKPVPLTEALSHQVKDQLEQERNRMREGAQKWKEDQQRKLEQDRILYEKELQDKMKEKIRKEMELKLQDSNNEREELKKQNQVFQEQILEMNKLVRQLRVQDEQRKLEMDKKLVEVEENMKEQIKKQLEDANHLKMLEMDKKLHDALKVNDELKRKLEQGSQQMQGEVLELDMEERLKREFPYDDITPVAKGVQGADLVQTVKNKYGAKCGTIMWETKRTKAWSQQWVTKLKDDQRNAKADIAVIVTQVLPPEIKRFGAKDGIWVTEYECIMGLAFALRKGLIDLTTAKQASIGKNSKMELLWGYLTSTEFTQRIEAIIDAFSTLQSDIEKEKRWFALKWSKQEKNMRKVLDATLGMHGELQSIVGKELSEVRGIEILAVGDIPESVTETLSTSPSPVIEEATVTESDGLFPS